MRQTIIGLCAFMAACGSGAPTAPGPSLTAIGGVSSSAGESANGQPHFNLEAILRGDGFGLVTLRQQKDPTQDILYMDAWVRDLLPNTNYSLQRAVDSPQDGVCTGTNWLTMGQGTTPRTILTDDTGTGRAELWRPVPPTALPADIHFRVVHTGTGAIALQSDCYQLLVRD